MSDEALNLTTTSRALRKIAAREAGTALPSGPRVRVRVTCIPEMQVLPGGHLASAGEQELVIYRYTRGPRGEEIDNLAEIQKLVEPHPEWIDEAREYVQLAKDKHLAEKTKGRQYRVPPTFADVADDYDGPLNWSHAFQSVRLRPCLPLTKLEVLEDLPPAETAEDRLETMDAQRLAAIVAEVLKQSGVVPDKTDRSESSGRRGK